MDMFKLLEVNVLKATPGNVNVLIMSEHLRFKRGTVPKLYRDCPISLIQSSIFF